MIMKYGDVQYTEKLLNNMNKLEDNKGFLMEDKKEENTKKNQKNLKNKKKKI